MLPAILAGLGTFAQTPLGQQAAMGLGSWGAGKLMNWMNAPQAPDQNVQAQGNYLQQIQQPINIGMGNRQQQLMNQFNQQILPGIQEQFAGAGGARSSAFGQQLGSAAGNLQTNLGALGEQNEYQNQQLNQQRLGELRGHLGQQQGFGLQAQELNQRGSIANQENALRAMGLMGNQNIAAQQEDLRRLLGSADIQRLLAALGLGEQSDIVRHGGSAANIGATAVGGAKAIGTGIKAAGYGGPNPT